jgi:citrate lyase subunit alpha/citrate CoA-transferase
MNGALGKFTSEGGMQGMGILRSHGGRYQAIQDGDLHIDIAVIAAPTADFFGNATGDRGPAACGLLGFALADSQYADKVVVVTDNLVPFPCVPWQIHGNYVDYVVVLDKVGIPEKIISGTTEITKSPDRLLLAELTAQFCDEAGIVRDGFSFQAGAGGTALSIGIYFAEMLRKRGMKARFARGGSNKYLVGMLEEGLVDYILDGQTFDLEGVRSMRENSNHLNTSPFTSYNYHGKGNFASMVDVVILGATEVDINFNANVVTHSDGYLLHGIGGWMNCLFSKCVILPIPLFRDRMPVIRDQVTTICGPGELIDVIVTERGIAINPLRTDLIEKLKGSALPIKSIHQLKDEAERICGKPALPMLSNEFIAAIKWVDGTVIDAVRKVIK